MKTTLYEIIHTHGWINYMSDFAEAKISEFKDITIETVQNETQREKVFK